jgi:DNA-binding GntR family transcriptional regulator
LRVKALPQAATPTAEESQTAGAVRPSARQDMAWDWAPDLMKSRAYEQVLLGIISGDLAPGERLDEHALTQRYGVGLAGVRDALGRLALESLVVRRPRSGTTVALLDHKEVDQVFEARRLIEPHCAALAAEKATPEEICAIRGAFVGAEAAIEGQDSLALVAMDQRFHAAVVRASRNPTLARIAIPLQHKASRFWVFAMERDTPAERLAEIQRHRVVADYIAKRDSEGARAQMLSLLGAPILAVTPARSRAS